MKKKNGFTLVELLAVVVVLAIILAIAIPRVLKMIETSRKKAFNISEVMMIKATREYVELGNVELPTIMEGEVELWLPAVVADQMIPIAVV